MNAKQAWAWTLAIGIALSSTACARKANPDSAPPPAAFSPQAFDDLPIPHGYAPLAGSEQLAVSYANGAVRRYLATYRQVLTEAVTGEDLKTWYAVRLQAQGWQITEDRWPSRQQWTRSEPNAETLRLESKHERDKTLLRITIAPAVEGGPGSSASSAGRR